MSKIGDLFVKLGLKKDGFDKGIKDAKTQTNGFANVVKKMKLSSVAAWAAIGAALVKFGKQVRDSNQRLSDSWKVATAQMSASWKTFTQSVASLDFSNFARNMKESVAAAKELAQAVDQVFENTNASRVLTASRRKEMVDLEQTFRSQQKTDKERIDAGRKLIKIYEEINRINEKAFKDVSEKASNRFLSGTRIGGTAAGREMLIRFLGEYNSTNKAFTDAVEWLSKNTSGINQKTGAIKVGGNYANNPQAWEKQKQQVLNVLKAELKKMGYAGTGNEIVNLADLALTYNTKRNDEDVKSVVDAFEQWKNQEVAVYEQNKRIVTGIDSLESQAGETLVTLGTDIGNIASEVEFILEDIDFDQYFENAERALDEFVANWRREQNEIKRLNDEFNNAIAGGFSNGMQVMMDALMSGEKMNGWAILQAVLEPLADMAIREGEIVLAGGLAIEAFKESLESLNGAAAIAAGVGLIAAGAAVKAGLSSLASNGGNSSAGTNYTGGSANTQVQNMEMTVYVKGKLSGSDIVISGQKTINSWNR